ncbi:MAG: HAMP domain-containing sensor histidine kinase [Peptoniphilus harei]|uniref:histidine kinase n=1 Tax=Peptoniphilus harei ACS-146-V-Sch2b TaxID=908338 RepID=E4KY66_9FIRM|nr:HAMP domain-containing sensor histidine kinase [Peptoniphilus harei]EFR33288.1 ATPase/histidine kinase/DNA gyrase B/HSP90 domain protein [Peptoniphilus harei ACS-146-V-Sch2b]MDK7754272.1 HAMP domain-containing sensor histidine kinase [Peptoniphilus harei]MDK7760078.1 HAMP domain-containing sensor histidine kinase [Peptoniphilus harei]MDK8271634.1 HAMP domain-containing sensor histidine kinase [Peptoniphilus harei]MDK8340068.1 HAMP domain-containing sensor histidine kinase [Peptoniphilus har
MKRIKNVKNTIVFKLILSIILIFIVMTATSNYIIGKYQEKRIQDIGEKIVMEETNKGNKDYFIVLEDSKLKSTKEIKNFSLIVIGSTIALGSLVYYFLVSRSLKPLKELKEKVQEIDIDKVDNEKKIYMEGQSQEIEELSLAFQKSLDKIYGSYAREKALSSSIAHELNTPVAVMKSSLEIYLMKNKVEDRELKELLDNFDENIDRISKIIESLLFLNRRENAISRKFDIKDLVEEIVFDLEDLAEEKNVNLISKMRSREIYTSDILLERVLYNLGKNAIAYNKEGGLVVFDFAEDEENYFIYVRDTGLGIDEEEKEKVFDLFYRVDESRNKKTGGYGIGLNLVKNIVEKLGGQVLISDNLNGNNEIRGSVFEVRLPKSKEEIL